MEIRKVRRLALGVLAAVLGTFTVLAGQGPGGRGTETPPLPPPSGGLSLTDEQVATIVAAVEAPDDFIVTAYAGPPVANYPTCVTATHDNVLFVCVDRNGSLQADPDMGYVLRIADRDDDGRADAYTVFAAMDSPRGAVFDGEWLYVSHPPFVTAHRDVNGDGIADESRTLVRGLGFGLDFRGADHTTNALEMGIDGWLYVAVGDYGVVKATGADGHEIQMRGGGNVRVRPDGSDLEIYARGTRNDYDLAIDPYLNLFARGNTNDGGGFDIRMYHFVNGMTIGYPSLFLNFSDEVVPPIADYGTGSGTGMLYVHDAGLPAPFDDALFSVDWGRNAIYRHPLKPNGTTFSVEQEAFVAVPRPNDMTIDGSSRLYIASWAGGQFRYAGEDVGFIARLTHKGASPTPAVDIAGATDARLVELVGTPNLVRVRAAQAELLRRGASAERMAMLDQLAGSGPLHRRVAAIFTLKQLAGVEATPFLVKLANDASVRAFALRALADRRGELAGVPAGPFIDALSASDPRTQLEAVTGLRRMGAVEAASAILPLTVSDDAVLANVATNALVALGAIDAPLAAVRGTSESLAVGALMVLQQIHQPAVVTGLIEALDESPTPSRRQAILGALARLANRDGVWRGTLAEWWGTRPDTTGPYYDPVAWDESRRIRAVLTRALLQSAGSGAGEVSGLLRSLEANRVVPPGGAALLTALATDGHSEFEPLARALVGSVRLEVTGATAGMLERIAGAGSAYRTAVTEMVVAAGVPSRAAAEILRAAAIDSSISVDVRAAAFRSLATATSAETLPIATEAFAVLAEQDSPEPPLEAVWTQFTTAPGHVSNLALFSGLVASNEPAHQRLGYVVLLRLAAEPPATGGRGRGGFGGRGRGPSPEAAAAARQNARKVIDAAWTGPIPASLVWAVGRVGATDFSAQLEALTGTTDADVREAVRFARARLAESAAVPAGPPAPAAGPLISAVAYEDVIERVSAMPGDAAVGRRLFEQQACSACHTTAPGEQEKGPPLGGIRTRYSRAEVLEAVLRPSAQVAQGFATNTFMMADGRQLAGFVVREGQEEVVVRDLTGTETTLVKAEIANRGVLAESTMPSGLVDSLTLSELASLLAFLESTGAN